jgi:hypothetical protein
MGRWARPLLLAVALAAAGSGASAHDSWLRPSSRAGLELATGNRFPRAEFPTNPATVVQPGCTDGSNPLALRPLQVLPTALSLLAVTRGAPPLACWVELAPYEVDLAPNLVPVYLDEIQASPQVRAISAQRQAAGTGWHERYRKFMRVESTVPQASAEARAAARRPVGHGLELLVRGDQPVLAGMPFEVRLLRDGTPLAGQPIELVGEQGAGRWSSTDAQGLLREVLPASGAWLLRGVDLRPADDGGWDSRFVTLLLQVP